MEYLQSELEEIANLCKSVNIENRELEKEINSLVRSADDVVVLVYSRRCLEVIITDICETSLGRDRGTEPLKGIIDKLSKEKLIPSFVLTAMQNVNNNSTYGAHPKDFDKRQVRSTLIDLTTVLDWYFFEFKKLEKKVVVPASKDIKAEKAPAKEPEIKDKSITKEPSKKSGSKPIIYIGVIILVVAIGVAIYFIVGKKTSAHEGSIAKVQDSITSSIKRDSIPIADSEKVEDVNKPENKDIAVADDKKETTTSKVTLLDLPADLEKALNIMNDKSISSKKRIASIPSFCERFTTDAQVVLLNADGFHLDDWPIKDYLTKRIAGSSLITIKVVGVEKEGNKIKLLKVEHKK